jgi:cellulose biosynthesis protein BcsQ
VDAAPTIDSAWAWFVGFVPPGWQPTLGIIAAVAILAWLLMNALKLVFELVRAWQDIRRKKQIESLPPQNPFPTKLPPPRVGIWNAEPKDPIRPKQVGDGGIPVITIANMKGGVGKTTLTANLAAYLDKQGKRVLLLDFDYQGSLSQTALAAANISKMGSAVDDLISGKKPIAAILEASQTLMPALPNSRILTCYYEFADAETYEMVRWLTGEAQDDLRFRLGRLLQEKVVSQQFDVVLIDAPPRFSTGTINALCASTHILIPTVLDQMSAEAVIYFSRDVAAMRSKLFPGLRLIGVVPTMVHQASEFTPRERGVVNHINQSLVAYWGQTKAVLEKAFIPRKNAIGDISGIGIGYIDAGLAKNTRLVREVFDRVGRVIYDQVK